MPIEPDDASEILVGFFPASKTHNHRVLEDDSGIRIFRREGKAPAKAGDSDAGSISPAEINARNRRFWKTT